MKRPVSALLAAGLLVAVGATPAFATEYVAKNGPTAQCPNTTSTHTTIQAGVDAASPNELVIVCDGIYREQVSIVGPTKDGVDLTAATVHGATIKSPATPLAQLGSGAQAAGSEALVYISGASNVKIRRFNIAGPGPGTVDSLRDGVLIENNANLVDAQVLDNVITDIRDSQAAANEEGNGVRIGRGYAGTAGRAFVLRNDIRNYQKAGIVVDGAGSFGLLSLNTIVGLGFMTAPVTPVPAQQGIQVGRGAGADVNSNTISMNQYSGSSGEASSGILVFNTTLARDPRLATRISRIKTNTVTSNDVGIYMQDVGNFLVETNRVYNNGDTTTAAPDGGISIAESTATSGGINRFNQNDARTNAGLDCEDTTTGTGTGGTDNTWTGNRGVDDAPAVICTP